MTTNLSSVDQQQSAIALKCPLKFSSRSPVPIHRMLQLPFTKPSTTLGQLNHNLLHRSIEGFAYLLPSFDIFSDVKPSQLMVSTRAHLYSIDQRMWPTPSVKLAVASTVCVRTWYQVTLPFALLASSLCLNFNCTEVQLLNSFSCS